MTAVALASREHQMPQAALDPIGFAEGRSNGAGICGTIDCLNRAMAENGKPTGNPPARTSPYVVDLTHYFVDEHCFWRWAIGDRSGKEIGFGDGYSSRAACQRAVGRIVGRANGDPPCAEASPVHRVTRHP